MRAAIDGICHCIGAARIIRSTKNASPSKISRSLGISYEEAEKCLQPFMKLGIIQPPDDVGFRKLNDTRAAHAILFLFSLGGKPRLKHIPPRWFLIDHYVELDRAAESCDWLSAEAFLNGPFRRFLEMAQEQNVPVRARARVMEYARQARMRHSEALSMCGEDVIYFQANSEKMAQRLLRADPDADYLLAVLDGKADHNRYR